MHLQVITVQIPEIRSLSRFRFLQSLYHSYATATTTTMTMAKWGARGAEEDEDVPVALPAAALLSKLSPPDDDEDEELCLCSASILSTETKNNVIESWNNFSKICSVVQGGSFWSGLTQYFVDLDFVIPSAMPILPVLQILKQNRAESGRKESTSTKRSPRPDRHPSH